MYGNYLEEAYEGLQGVDLADRYLLTLERLLPRDRQRALIRPQIHRNGYGRITPLEIYDFRIRTI